MPLPLQSAQIEMPTHRRAGQAAPVRLGPPALSGRAGFLPHVCQAIIAETGHEVEPATVVFNDVLNIVSAQVSNLPLRIRWKLAAGLLVFRVMVFFISGRAFEALSEREKVALLKRFSYGPIYPYRMLFRALRALTLFAYFEHSAVMLTVGSRANLSLASSSRR